MTTNCCCAAEGTSRPLARRFGGAAASVLPGAALVLLPKCPLCLAAWLTLALGVGVSGAAAVWIRDGMVALAVVAAAIVATKTLRRWVRVSRART